jgi:hypothetical protein
VGSIARGIGQVGVVLVLLGVCVGNARADTTFTGTCDACVAQYSGTFTEHQVEPVSSAPQYEYTTDVKINWSQNVVYNGDQSSTAQPLKAYGTYEVTNDVPGGGSGDTCVAQIYQYTTSAISWGQEYADENGGKHITGYDVIADAPALQLTGDEDCDQNYNGYEQYDITAWSGAGCPIAGPGIDTTLPIGGPYKVSDTCVYDNTDAQGGTTDDTATDSLTWQSAGSAPPGGPTVTPVQLGPDFPAAKNQARGDLIRVIKNFPPACVGFAGGGLLYGTGILLSSAPGGSGATLVVAGGLISSALGPVCTPTIARAIIDYKTFEDPPLDSIHVLARPATVRPPKLPACRRDVRACTALRTALGSLDTAALDALADATALEKTVSREHAAALEGNQTAVDAQDRDIGRLEPAFSRAQRAEASAERAVASALRGAHIEFRLSRAQSSRLLARVEREIVRGGVRASQITAVDRNAFRPAATNLLSVLG